jgi:hypothetical protein
LIERESVSCIFLFRKYFPFIGTATRPSKITIHTSSKFIAGGHVYVYIMNRMNRILILIAAIATLSAAVVADIYSSLGISKEKAKERLLECIAEGRVMTGDQSQLVSRARNIPVEMRVAGIRQLISLAKEYTASEEFKNDYQKWRKNHLGPGQKSKLGVPRLRRILDNAVDNAIDSKDNENKYPTDPQKLIKKRLEEFIEVSGSVDFDARLSGRSFANTEYEGKDDQWKMCYRAGREVVAAAREEAKKWLSELQ